MLTAEEKQEMRELVAEAVAEALRNGDCTCNLSAGAQAEIPHLMGMVKDVGHGSHSAGIEVMRENSRMLTRFRTRVDRFAQGIAWLIIASGIGGVLWLVSEGCKAAIKATRG